MVFLGEKESSPEKASVFTSVYVSGCTHPSPRHWEETCTLLRSSDCMDTSYPYKPLGPSRRRLLFPSSNGHSLKRGTQVKRSLEGEIDIPNPPLRGLIAMNHIQIFSLLMPRLVGPFAPPPRANAPRPPEIKPLEEDPKSHPNDLQTSSTQHFKCRISCEKGQSLWISAIDSSHASKEKKELLIEVRYCFVMMLFCVTLVIYNVLWVVFCDLYLEKRQALHPSALKR